MSCFLGPSTNNKSREIEGSSIAAPYEQQNLPCKLSIVVIKLGEIVRFYVNIFQICLQGIMGGR